MLLALVSLASAGLRDDISALGARGPEMAAACTSADAMVARLDTTIGAMASEGADGELEEVARGFRHLRTSGVFAPGARLEMLLFPRPGAADGASEDKILEMRFGTTLDAGGVARAAAAMDPEKTQAVPGADGSWELRDVGEGDGNIVRITVENGLAVMRDGVPAEAADARAIPPALLGAVPDSGGCLVSFHQTQAMTGEFDLLFHVPDTQGQPVRFAAASAQLASLPGGGAAWAANGWNAPTVLSDAAPIGLLVLGLGLSDFPAEALEAGERAALKRIRRLLPVARGTTVGVMSVEPPVVSAMIPLEQPMKARKVARRVRGLLKKLRIDAQVSDSTHFTVSTPLVELSVAATDGRIYLSNVDTMTRVLERGSGTPWLDTTTARLASEFPVVLSFGTLPGMDGQPPVKLDRPITFALTGEPGVLRGQIDVPIPPEQLARLAAQARAAAASAATEAPVPLAPPAGASEGGAPAPTP